MEIMAASVKAKRCKACGFVLPLTDFFRHPNTSDGHFGKCKACKNAYQKEWREKNADYVHETDRIRRRTEEHREYSRQYEARMCVSNPSFRAARSRKQRARDADKNRVRNLTSRAIARGILTRQPCERCGHEKTQAHHDDYSRPLDVRWLCRRCHAAYHVAKRDAERAG